MAGQSEPFEGGRMNQQGQEKLIGVDRVRLEMLSLLREPAPVHHWVSAGQPRTWRPPTDVYETDDQVVVKVEIAGMQEEDFSIALESKRLIIRGIRHDPAAKLAYQQMEILYGYFETDAYLPGAIDPERIEAIYQDGFLSIFLSKARPRHVPVTGGEECP